MQMITLDDNYWENRYRNDHTPWDIGFPSPPICSFIDQLPDPEIAILIPGAGKAHEAAYLWNKGFKNISICDWAPSAFESLHQKFPNFPQNRCLVNDFFQLEGTYDLILEQTFFCALNPGLRNDYVNKVFDLLKPGGKIAGLLFASHFAKPGPPFGGEAEEYRKLFERKLRLKNLAIAENSIGPRAGNELFFVAVKQ